MKTKLVSLFTHVKTKRLSLLTPVKTKLLTKQLNLLTPVKIKQVSIILFDLLRITTAPAIVTLSNN